MNRQAMMGQHADRNTTESDTEESVSSRTATDDSTTETASIDTQGNMGTTPQGRCLMVSERKERCQAVGVSKAETLLQGNLSTFMQALGCIIIIFVIGGFGLVTSVISRKTAA